MGKSKKLFVKRVGFLSLALLCLFATFFAQTAHADANSTSVTLKVEQIFNRLAGSPTVGVFHYEMTLQYAQNPMPAGCTGGVYNFELTGTESKEIGPIVFSTPGVFTYKVAACAEPTEIGCANDNRVYIVEVHCESGLETGVVITNEAGKKVSGIQFEPTYTPLASKPSSMITPPVKNTVSGSPAQTSIFTFKLKAGNTAYPMPPGSTGGEKLVTIAGSGQADFGTWSYTQAGTYYYTVSEVNTGIDGYTYDTMVYTITDTVTDVNGQLVLTRIITNASNKPVESFDFINRYASSLTGGNADAKPAGSTGVSAGSIGYPGIVVGGIQGPKTGDDSTPEVYGIFFGMGSIVFSACTIFLIVDRKRSKNRKDRI